MPSYVVTGASRGIGLEYVRQLSMIPENTVFALVRNTRTALAIPSSPLNQNLANVHVIEADVTDHKALKVAASKVAQVTGGSLDVLINNAAACGGDNDWRSLLDFEGEDELLEKEFDLHFKVNVVGVIHSTNSFLPLLRKGMAKKVVTITSGAGDCENILKLGMTQVTAYGASKGAANVVVAKYAVKLQEEGFTVIALSPGMVDTFTAAPAKNSEWIAAIEEKVKKMYPNFPGMITPEASVRTQLEVIARCNPKDSGSILPS